MWCVDLLNFYALYESLHYYVISVYIYKSCLYGLYTNMQQPCINQVCLSVIAHIYCLMTAEKGQNFMVVHQFEFEFQILVPSIISFM